MHPDLHGKVQKGRESTLLIIPVPQGMEARAKLQAVPKQGRVPAPTAPHHTPSHMFSTWPPAEKIPQTPQNPRHTYSSHIPPRRLPSPLLRSTEPAEGPTKLLPLPARRCSQQSPAEVGRAEHTPKVQQQLHSSHGNSKMWLLVYFNSEKLPKLWKWNFHVHAAEACLCSTLRAKKLQGQAVLSRNALIVHQASGEVPAPLHTVKPRGWKSIPARDEHTPQKLLGSYIPKNAGLSLVKWR